MSAATVPTADVIESLDFEPTVACERRIPWPHDRVAVEYWWCHCATHAYCDECARAWRAPSVAASVGGSATCGTCGQAFVIEPGSARYVGPVRSS